MSNIAPGEKLGTYTIEKPIGAGGMGVVYRARDTKLDRAVAIKVLPPSFASTPDSLARFQLEARAAGGLNHPNLVTIHELGTHEDSPYIVMELLEGETLREKLHSPVRTVSASATGESHSVSPETGTALPIRKAIEYGVQLAHGLAAAHDRGIVHRDLKPENIFITPDGRVKILDFGLAKLTAPAEDDKTAARTPPSHETTPGTVMGTAGYMAPEQVRGQTVDHRADIFSFGSVLYEMLSGRRAFSAESAVETMNAILRDDPPEFVSAQSGVAPSPALDRIVQHCLEKSPAERFQSISDVAFALQHLSTSFVSASVENLAPPPRKGSRLRTAAAWAVALAAGIAIGALLRGTLIPPPAPPPKISPLTFSGRDSAPALSPDGRMIAYVSSRTGTPQIWVRQMTGGAELRVSEGRDWAPRWSSDSATILFARERGGTLDIYRVSALGGDARRLVEEAGSADWSRDGSRLAFVRYAPGKETNGSVVLVASADGSDAKEIARIPNKFMTSPRWSPDGTRISLADTSAGYSNREPVIVGIDGQIESLAGLLLYRGIHSAISWLDDRTVLLSEIDSATYAPTGSSSRVFFADIKTGKRTVLVYTNGLNGCVELTSDGRLILDAGVASERIQELSLTNQSIPAKTLTSGSSMDRQPTYSPNGEWIAFSSTMSGNLDIWAVSTKDASLRRLTDDPGDDFDPAFTPDGKQIIWSSRRSGNYEIWIANFDGTNSRKVTSDGTDAENPTITRDGQWIVYNSYDTKKRGLWKIRPDGSEASRIVAGDTQLPDLSPDGTHVLYPAIGASTRVMVARVSDGKILSESQPTAPTFFVANISFAFGRGRWRPDSRAIAYLDRDASGPISVYVQEFDPSTGALGDRAIIATSDPLSPIETFGFSPDGTKLAVSVLVATDSIGITDPIPALKR